MGQRHYSLWMCLICIIAFVLQIAFPVFTDMFILDANSFIQPWRFVTAMFLHGSLGHLIFNMFALVIFGLVLESVVGSKKFLRIFFISGVVANLIAVNYYPASLGASGAIYGILGALVILRPMMTVWVYNLPMPMFVAGIVWVIGGIMGLFYPSNIGHIAHLSGIGIGFIFGLIYRDWSKKLEARKQRVIIDEKSIRHWEDAYVR
ncbi:MAG: rhomboid family intramembrane serine protease [Candidatus Pacearchaeota archaeon]